VSDLSRYIPALLDIGSTVDGQTFYISMFPYPSGTTQYDFACQSHLHA
jgi:hypothetical protein